MDHHKGESKTGAFRCCCCTLLAILVAAVIVFLVVVLVLKPKKPEFTLEDVRIVNFELDQPPPMTTSGLEVLLTLQMELTVAAQNPNKLGLRYSAMKIVIYYRNYPVGLAIVPAFYQPAHSKTRVTATLLVDKVNVLEGNAISLLEDANNGLVNLVVAGKVPARVTILGVNTPRLLVDVRCAIAVNPKRQQLLAKQCGVKDVQF